MNPGWLIAGLMVGERVAAVPSVQRAVSTYAPYAIRLVRQAQRALWPAVARVEAPIRSRFTDWNGWR